MWVSKLINPATGIPPYPLIILGSTLSVLPMAILFPFGGDYSQLISYSQGLRSSPGTGPDLLDQFGTFNAAQHYGFVRVSGKIDDKLTGAAWTTVNLQDFSGLTGIDLSLAYDKWTFDASVMNAWGSSGTEAGLSPLLWKIDLELGVYL